MNGKELAMKYYDVYITGTAKVDDKGVPMKNEAGILIEQWSRNSNPSADLKEKGFTSGRFFQTEMVEVNVGKDILIAEGSGKQYELGPMTLKGQPVTVFESKQREIYKSITERIVAGKIEIVVPMRSTVVNGVTTYQITGRLTQYAMPGYLLQFDCGFWYYLFQRNRTTHVLEAIEPWTYNNQGKPQKMKVARNTSQIFLFANELIAADAHVKAAIQACSEFKVPEDASGNERKEELLPETKATAGDIPIV